MEGSFTTGIWRSGISPRPWLRLGRKIGLPPMVIFLAAWSVALAQPAIKTGPEVNSTVPKFQAPDQNGQMQDLKSLAGPNGAMLVFFRSADW